MLDAHPVISRRVGGDVPEHYQCWRINGAGRYESLSQALHKLGTTGPIRYWRTLEPDAESRRRAKRLAYATHVKEMHSLIAPEEPKPPQKRRGGRRKKVAPSDETKIANIVSQPGI